MTATPPTDLRAVLDGMLRAQEARFWNLLTEQSDSVRNDMANQRETILREIPASAYTPGMDILGVIPDIPVFKGDRVPVSRNALTPGTRSLQLLPAPSSDFPIRHDTDAMCGFQSEMIASRRRELREAAVLASSCVTQLFKAARPCCL
ncbi:hypothetical protein JCGZ_10634 [Jatropha curcas]|uniref:Uncharacterized protein n=1 Tax=Jatropha curcas TaxID=180498 RepID=A0A067KU79_JATCU|nr:hypothetical protein JCGZ_10634 [Jatropha curcas]